MSCPGLFVPSSITSSSTPMAAPTGSTTGIFTPTIPKMSMGVSVATLVM